MKKETPSLTKERDDLLTKLKQIQQDYDGLAGVFASTRIADRALVDDVDSLKVIEAHKQVKQWETEIKKHEAELKKIETEISKLAEAAKKFSGQDSPDAKSIEELDKNTKASAEQVTKAEEKSKLLAKLKEQIAEAQSTKGYALPLAPGALDATLEVKAAIGTHGSRIVYEDKAKDMAVEIRGNPNKLGPVVPRRFVSVLSPDSPKNFSRGSGRLELAQCMFDESQPLLARVLVNRIWKQHFGIGLVETPSDFGRQGERPTHPELLDDLARQFIASGWSLKGLHRQMILSATYQQVSGRGPEVDPSNRYYSRFNLRKLNVEEWRDAMLVATDSLDRTMGGPPAELSQSDFARRTIYGTVRRRELSDLLRLHDFPDPLTHSPNRVSTTTPLQQLYYFNSPFIQDQAIAMAARMQREYPNDLSAQVVGAYRLLFCRNPSSHELALGIDFLKSEASGPQSSKIEDRWPHYAQVLFGSNEFFFVD